MTVPRWEDALGHALKLLREERTSLVAELPRIESVDERELFDAWVARVDLALATIGRIDDAALARLAEPAQSSAATTSSPCARCGHAWHEHVDRDSDNACQANGCPCARWYGGAQSSTPAAPAQPSAAERWRAVPADVRRIVLRWVERGQAQAHRDNVDAYHALTELAREAEGGGR